MLAVRLINRVAQFFDPDFSSPALDLLAVSTGSLQGFFNALLYGLTPALLAAYRTKLCACVPLRHWSRFEDAPARDTRRAFGSEPLRKPGLWARFRRWRQAGKGPLKKRVTFASEPMVLGVSYGRDTVDPEELELGLRDDDESSDASGPAEPDRSQFQRAAVPPDSEFGAAPDFAPGDFGAPPDFSFGAAPDFTLGDGEDAPSE